MNKTECDECLTFLYDAFPGCREASNETMAEIWSSLFARFAKEVVIEAIRMHRKESEYRVCQPVHIESRCKSILLERQRHQPQEHARKSYVVFREMHGITEGDATDAICIHFNEVYARLLVANEPGRSCMLAMARGHMKAALIESGMPASEAHQMASEYTGTAPDVSFIDGLRAKARQRKSMIEAERQRQLEAVR